MDRGSPGARPRAQAPRARDAEAPQAEDVEAALLRRMARGDESALVALFARRGGLVHAVCLRILESRAEAEDATSEAFWRFWERAERFDPRRSSAMAWILTVTRRLALDRRRSLRRRGRMLERYASQLRLRESAPAPLADDVEALSVLARLSPEDRRLLESAYFEGLSGADIATRDALPLGTVKSRLRAALARLRIAYHRGKP